PPPIQVGSRQGGMHIAGQERIGKRPESVWSNVEVGIASRRNNSLQRSEDGTTVAGKGQRQVESVRTQSLQGIPIDNAACGIDVPIEDEILFQRFTLS